MCQAPPPWRHLGWVRSVSGRPRKDRGLRHSSGFDQSSPPTQPSNLNKPTPHCASVSTARGPFGAPVLHARSPHARRCDTERISRMELLWNLAERKCMLKYTNSASPVIVVLIYKLTTIYIYKLATFETAIILIIPISLKFVSY